jgi:hypothetical protein
MKYHRVILRLDDSYAVQTRKRGFWVTVHGYKDRDLALSHLHSLNNGTLFHTENIIGDDDFNDFSIPTLIHVFGVMVLDAFQLWRETKREQNNS